MQILFLTVPGQTKAAHAATDKANNDEEADDHWQLARAFILLLHCLLIVLLGVPRSVALYIWV